MPRGGRRTGTPGSSYGQRTDLNRQLPVQTAPAQQYGQGVAQMRAQQAVPMAAPPAPAPAGQPAAAPPAPAAAPAGPAPGSLGALDRPTERPNEPLTAGLPIGPGPGPDALGLGGTVAPTGNLSVVLAQVAASSGSTDLAFLAQQARNLGQ